MTEHQGAFKTGRYINLFKEYGYSDSEIDSKVNEVWQKLFFGSDDIRIYHSDGNDMGYMVDTGNNDVRTEGMSYGMMMALQMDNKEVFDRLWKWTKTYMWHDSGEYKGYFAWSCNLDGTRRSQGPAPDGEEYFAMALIFASRRWGDGSGIYNYGKEAKEILHEVIHKGEKGKKGYPMWNSENRLIKFIPECDFSDPSYHVPHFYELFSRWGLEEDRQFWLEAAEASREYLKKACHPDTGLAAEYANFDGSPNNTRGHGHFYSDSYRVALNVGLDYEWFGEDSRLKEIANNIINFFADKEDFGIYKINGEKLDKKPDYLHHVGLIATNAAAALAADTDNAKAAVKRFWNTPLRRDKRRYYDNCLYFFSLLALSGNYKIY